MVRKIYGWLYITGGLGVLVVYHQHISGGMWEALKPMTLAELAILFASFLLFLFAFARGLVLLSKKNDEEVDV